MPIYLHFRSLKRYLIVCSNCFIVRLACGRVLEECLSLNNREYVVNKGYLKKLVATAEKLNKNPEQQRMSLSIMESLFKHSTATTYRYVERVERIGKEEIFSDILLYCCITSEYERKGRRDRNMNFSIVTSKFFKNSSAINNNIQLLFGI